MTFSFPLVFLAYSFSVRINHVKNAGRFLQVSTHVVTETIGNIKTVVAYGAEEYFVQKVSQHLRSHTL